LTVTVQFYWLFNIEGPQGQMPKKEEKKEINNKKYYELLGIDNKASDPEIKRAFRRKAVKEHPDKGGDPEKVAYISHTE